LANDRPGRAIADGPLAFTPVFLPGPSAADHADRRARYTAPEWTDGQLETGRPVGSPGGGEAVRRTTAALHDHTNQRSLKIATLAPGVGALTTVSELGPTDDTSTGAVATVAPTSPGPVTGVTLRRLGRRLAIGWRRANGAKRYIITITVRGNTRVTLLGIAVDPSVTLNHDTHVLLDTGAFSRITIRSLALGGQLGPAGTATYTAPTNGRHRPPSLDRGPAREAAAGIA
jgi:hypothetical protein